MHQQDQYVIEIKLDDYVDSQLLNDNSPKHAAKFFELVYSHIEEELGGVLCLSHYILPLVKVKSLTAERTVVISCCCYEHIDIIRHRLTDALR